MSDFEPQEPKRKKQKVSKKKKKHKKHKKSKTNQHQPSLPSHLSNILSHYQLIETAIIFLDNKAIPLKVTTICTLVARIMKETWGLTLNFTNQDICQVWNFTTDIWDIAWQAQFSPDQWNSKQTLGCCIRLSDTMTQKINWKGKRPKAAREKLITERLIQYVKDHGLEQRPTPKTMPLHPDDLNQDEDIVVPKCPVASELVEKRNVSEMLTHIQSLPFYENQIVYVKSFPPKLAEYIDLNVSLSPSLYRALKETFHLTSSASTITSNQSLRLYRHQTLGIQALMSDNKHVVVSTGTSSGKSMIYNIPVLDSIIKDPDHSTGKYNTKAKESEHRVMEAL